MFAVSKIKIGAVALLACVGIALSGCSNPFAGPTPEQTPATARERGVPTLPPEPGASSTTKHSQSATPVENIGGYLPEDLCSNKPGVQSKVPAGLILVVASVILVDPTLPTDITTECVTPSVVKQRVALMRSYEQDARAQFKDEFLSRADVQAAQGDALATLVMDYYCASKGGKEAYYRSLPSFEYYETVRDKYGMDLGFYDAASTECSAQLKALRTYASGDGVELHTATP